MRAAFLGVTLVTLACGACSGGKGARDVAGDRGPRRGGRADADAGTGNGNGNGADGVREVPPVLAEPMVAGKRARVLTRAAARSLAVDSTNLYYGDTDNDGVYAMPKSGGAPVRLARHAPVAGAIAVDSDSITWIASPGDTVLRLPIRAAASAASPASPASGPPPQPTTLRDRGIFSDVTTAGGDVFIAEVVGAGGALVRVTGATAARLAAFDGSPRAVVADATHAYVITPTKILRTPHVRGELETVATGMGFGSPQLDASFLYLVAEVDKTNVIARVPKTGGPLTVLARDVRDLPIDVEGGEVFFFAASRPQVRAVRVNNGHARVVVEDEMLTSANTLVADPTTVFMAAGASDTGVILSVDRR